MRYPAVQYWGKFKTHYEYHQIDSQVDKLTTWPSQQLITSTTEYFISVIAGYWVKNSAYYIYTGNHAHDKSSEESYWPITSEESQLCDYYLIHKHIFFSLLSQGNSRESFRFPH